MKMSTGALFFSRIGGRANPVLLGLDVFALGTRMAEAGEPRLSGLGGSESVWGAGCGELFCSVDGRLATCRMSGVEVVVLGFAARSAGEIKGGVCLAMVAGLVKALSRFSLSSVVRLLVDGRWSSCSILLFLGEKIVTGLTVRSMGCGAAGFRCSSINLRGAVTIVLLVVAGLSLISDGLMIPEGRSVFWWLK